MFSPDFREFVELLNKNDVLYMIVGGYAVGFHGHPRYTGDLDIWLLPTTDNAFKIVKAIGEFGFGSLGISEKDLSTEGLIVQLGHPPLRIDLLTSIDGVKFEECYLNKKTTLIDGLPVHFISYDDLIRNKKASGRHQDLGDIENLLKN
ncbi:MAG: nucleotidyltransferase [Chitinophagaceae bacterium]